MLLLSTAQMLRARVRNDPSHIIRPRLLVDGRLGVSEQVLVDPYHAHVRSYLEAGEVAASPPAFSVLEGDCGVVDGKVIRVAADDQAWSLVPTASGHRFEVRASDIGLRSDPANAQRSELVGRPDQFKAGDEVWQSFTSEINVADGFAQVITGAPNWGLIAQWHSIDTTVGRSPVLGFDYGNNAFRVVTRSDAEYSNGVAVEKVRFSDTLPVGSVNYVCRFVLGQAGELQVWRNGVEIVSIECPIGYYNDVGNLAYLQWGIYRKSSTLPAAVTTSNMRWGLTDLSEKILSPEPL
jgi:hypothetical protein